ncbi:MAG: hypothetical protein IPI49_18040 [Myxococcales bacterium]|nr:hypothetical protein [Myxococcales bacterium]HRC58158.1 hypothetical protein [Kofleriaceae bacterium]
MIFGIAFAVLARDRVRADGAFSLPAFVLVLQHAGAVATVALYFYAVHPAWAGMYLVDPRHVSGVLVLPLMVGHGALVVGGWYGAAQLVRRGQLQPVLYAGGVLLLLTLLLGIGARTRLSTASDFAGYAARRGVALFSVELGWAVLVALLALASSAAYVAIELLRDGRRVRVPVVAAQAAGFERGAAGQRGPADKPAA